MHFFSKLRDKGDHFVITVYKEDRDRLNIFLKDLLILKINNNEIIRMVMKDFHVSLPKRLLENQNHGDPIKIEILNISKMTECVKRPKELFNNKLDLRYFIPKYTIHKKPIYIFERCENTYSVWYNIGGGVEPVTFRNNIILEELAELIGFYFGDGSTSNGISSFRLTNSEPSVLNYCLNILEKIGIQRSNFKIQIIYSTNKEITNEIQERCSIFWSNILKIKKENIVSVLKAKNIRETLTYGNARLFIDSTVLIEIFLHGILKEVITRITKPKDQVDIILLKGFMRGLLAAEGSPVLNINNSLVKVGISFDPHSSELELYKSLLKNLNISYGKAQSNQLFIYSYKNMTEFSILDAFKMHNSRKEKFLIGYANHKFSKNSIF